ncbi:HNH endonuclease family protein [Rhodovibrio sodomensis]|nr:HNH endonuclease family protein [Rhodovibrio sodomensis]
MHPRLACAAIAALVTVALHPLVAEGHGGGLDSHGCHNNRAEGIYECHRGPLSGHSFPSKSEMLQRLNAISGGGTSSGAPAPSGFQEYDRALYSHWSDADRDCQDARQEVLISESRRPVQLSADGCDVVSGLWIDPYTGARLTDPSDLHVDHIVPLAEAHRSGAHRWSHAKRKAYANDLEDPRSLIAVSAGANMSKGADDPAHWLPENRSYRCTYVREWVAVKRRWDLSMDPAERRAADQVLTTCRNRGR